jgi:serine/threonine-protein kinase RsbT
MIVDLDITNELDVLFARNTAKSLAGEMGFSREDIARIDLAVSELAHNLISHATHGKLILNKRFSSGQTVFEAVSLDNGPGIDDLERVFELGYSTKGSLGIGLNSVLEVVDELLIDSDAGKGTQVIVRKWLR